MNQQTKLEDEDAALGAVREVINRLEIVKGVLDVGNEAIHQEKHLRKISYRARRVLGEALQAAEYFDFYAEHARGFGSTWHSQAWAILQAIGSALTLLSDRALPDDATSLRTRAKYTQHRVVRAIRLAESALSGNERKGAA